MESQTQKQQPNSKSILDMAQKAMRDMDSLIKEMRQARSNVNRLVQIAPSDKPVYLIEASTQAEAKFRQAKTDLNLWIQKHFRGGEEWSDQPEQNDHCDIDEKFNLGHNHHIEVVNGGFLHTCCQMSCRHYENVSGGNYPNFTDGHDEHGTMVGEGELIWTCPNKACQHFRRGKGEDEVDFEPKHAQLQFFTDYFYSGIEDSDSSDDSFGEVYDMVRDEISRDSRRRAVARQDAEDYLRNSLNARFHDALVDAYRWRNTWCEWDEKVETAYPNC